MSRKEPHFVENINVLHISVSGNIGVSTVDPETRHSFRKKLVHVRLVQLSWCEF